MMCVVAILVPVETGVPGANAAMVDAEAETESPDGFLTVGMSEPVWYPGVGVADPGVAAAFEGGSGDKVCA
jgi:hypothetical protein